MTDLARLGFRADTGELKDAKASLDALVPSAKRAEAATEQLSLEFMNMGTSAGKAAQGAQAAKTGMEQAAAGAQRGGVAAGAAAGMWDRFTGAVGRLISRLSGVAPAASGATSSLNRMGRAANDNINAMQSTPGNIAAQFQDIGVTAAAGMNPMLIALQQGTQLSAAMAGGMKNLLAGLAQVFSATTLLTIGIVGLLAAFIQWVDWIGLAKAALNGLADIMVDIAPYAVGIAAALALIYAPAIIAGIWSLVTAFAGLAASMLATIGIPALIVLGLAAIIAAANYWRDDMTKIFGVDIVAAAKDGINFIVGSFVGAYNTILKVWERLPDALGDAAYQAANRVASALNGVLTLKDEKGNVLWTPFSQGGMSNPYAGALRGVGGIAQGEFQQARGVDYVGGAISGVQGIASDAADYLRSLAGGLGGDAEAGSGRAGRSRRERQKTGDSAFKDFFTNMNRQLRGLMDVNAQIGVYGEALSRLKFEQQLFNQAQDSGIKMTAELSEELKRRAAEMASLEFSTIRDQFRENQRRDHEETMSQLGRERNEIGLSGEALIAYRIETDLLADARAKNIELNDAEIAGIHDIAAEQARAIETMQKARDALNEQRAAAAGFFKDWFGGIREGKNIFTSFVDAVISGLERIIQKMLDRTIDQFLNMMFQDSNGTQGSGILGAIIGAAFGSPMAGGVSKSAGTFGTGAVKGFAKGGVVDRPTLFTFAKGGAVGQMGEAGREAIMPLTRTADGTLGVRASGGAGGTMVNAPVEINNNYYLTGALSSKDIVAMVRQSGEQTKADLARELPQILAQYDRDGTRV